MNELRSKVLVMRCRGCNQVLGASTVASANVEAVGGLLSDPDLVEDHVVTSLEDPPVEIGRGCTCRAIEVEVARAMEDI